MCTTLTQAWWQMQEVEKNQSLPHLNSILKEERVFMRITGLRTALPLCEKLAMALAC